MPDTIQTPFGPLVATPTQAFVGLLPAEIVDEPGYHRYAVARPARSVSVRSGVGAFPNLDVTYDLHYVRLSAAPTTQQLHHLLMQAERLYCTGASTACHNVFAAVADIYRSSGRRPTHYIDLGNGLRVVTSTDAYRVFYDRTTACRAVVKIRPDMTRLIICQG